VIVAFIIRIEFDGRRWLLTLQDLTTGERRGFVSFEACFAALRERSEERVRTAPDSTEPADA
jgi:hypothetical protein